MKTLLIKCQVPDSITPGQIRVTYPGVLPGIAAGFKVITKPTEEEIFNEALGHGIERGEGIIQGVNWTLKRMGL